MKIGPSSAYGWGNKNASGRRKISISVIKQKKQINFEKVIVNSISVRVLYILFILLFI
jgi:hypothetical protein